MDKVTGIFTAIGYLSTAYYLGFPLDYVFRKVDGLGSLLAMPYQNFLTKSQEWQQYNAADSESRRH